jgi:hypothetical protein
MGARTIILAVAASAAVCGCGSGEPQLACTGHQVGGREPRCTPGAGLHLTGTGHSLRPAWRGYFDSAGAQGWLRLEARPGRLRVVRRADVPAALGRFTVRPGDLVRKGERAELVASVADTGAHEGAEAWYAWSTFLPQDLHPAPYDTFNVLTQFHGARPDACSPSLQLNLDTRPSPPRLVLLGRGGRLPEITCKPEHKRTWDLGPVRLGRWNDFVLHVRWSASARHGLVELSRNARRLVPPTRFPTLFANENAYLKQGFYRDHYGKVSRLYQTGVTRFTATRP